MDVPGLLTGANVLTRPAEEFENDTLVEALWAKKAFEYAEVHFNLICSVDTRFLTLTNVDDEVYRTFRQYFPHMRVDIVNEDKMKSANEKEKWRSYINKLKNKIEDHSFGTLLRSDCSDEYTETNTMLSTRIQFYAIEVARNREGFNEQLKNKFPPKPPANENSEDS